MRRRRRATSVSRRWSDSQNWFSVFVLQVTYKFACFNALFSFFLHSEILRLWTERHQRRCITIRRLQYTSGSTGLTRPISFNWEVLEWICMGFVWISLVLAKPVYRYQKNTIFIAIRYHTILRCVDTLLDHRIRGKNFYWRWRQLTIPQIYNISGPESEICTDANLKNQLMIANNITDAPIAQEAHGRSLSPTKNCALRAFIRFLVSVAFHFSDKSSLFRKIACSHTSTCCSRRATLLPIFLSKLFL